MSEIDHETDVLVGDWLTLPEVAERLGISVGQVKQLLRQRKLIGVQREPGSQMHVPAAFLRGDHVLKGLHGTLTLLADSGYNEVESLRWLFTADDSLPGTPVQALAENRSTEVNRRAEVLGF
ncbi:MAG: DNA-binding protein [Streptosporangiales bacterium]|nr:DNA-binding protein [Streptosporangiales bacterium]